MKQLTAMQQMISQLRQYKASFNGDPVADMILNTAIGLGLNNLFAEKQQTIDAWVNKELFVNNPVKDNEGTGRIMREVRLAENYFNETFKTDNDETTD